MSQELPFDKELHLQHFINAAYCLQDMHPFRPTYEEFNRYMFLTPYGDAYKWIQVFIKLGLMKKVDSKQRNVRLTQEGLDLWKKHHEHYLQAMK